MDPYQGQQPEPTGPIDLNQPIEANQQFSTVPQGYQTQKKTCIWSILSLIFAFLFPLIGIIFGIVALVQISNNSSLKGKGLAIAGIILSIAWFPLLMFIGAIAYFGVLSPANLLPEKCEFPSGLACTETAAASISNGNGNQICFPVTNTLGYDVTGVEAKVEGCKGFAPVDIQNGASANICFDQCSGTLNDGDNYRYDVELLYTSADTGISRSAFGSVSGKWHS